MSNTPAHPEDTPAVGALVPQKHGGALKRGNPGNKGGGSPSSAIREVLRKEFKKRIPTLRKIAANKDGQYTVSDQLKAADLLAKYGMGTPVEVGGPDGTPFTLVVKAAQAND